MMKKNTWRGLVFALCALALTACAGPGELTKFTGEIDGQTYTLVAHNQQVPDWMLATDKLALNFVVKGDVTERQLAALASAEHSCRIYTKTVRPNELVAVLANGTLYGIAGFLGTGTGSQAFTGANFTDYGLYGGAAGFAGGVANGIVQSGGKTYTFENCGREVMSLFPQYSNLRILQKSPY